ncbi:uncharacterized protein LOC133860170 [Alnus glutinosa]|uniref:uncharacterized protein LOC133860170 n=1 Tax=Alnus glutinosa TaxID=3517 RepID=UPI002D789C75|nr:uncharacterized protein LOC133860170 [Alnus glutinosa]XP_062151812.1 uncharacterized protein LOC133860170 [Alnus glutinosa]XP_062151814.1 uncharacterized protein LOC133860170 [Alnus glutinosa]
MPLTCMNKEVGIRIGDSLGKVAEVDVTGDGIGWGRCLRIQSFLDLTKPLERGKAVLINGKSVWISFKYEKLPQFCYSCGRIFHGENKCRGNGGFRLNGEAVVKQWGAWMRADDLRFQKGRFLKGASSEAPTVPEDSGNSGADGEGNSVDKSSSRTGRIIKDHQTTPTIPSVEATIAATVHNPQRVHRAEVVVKESLSQLPIEGGILRKKENVENEGCSVGPLTLSTEDLMECYMHKDHGGLVHQQNSLVVPAVFVAASLMLDDHACKGDMSLVKDIHGVLFSHEKFHHAAQHPIPRGVQGTCQCASLSHLETEDTRLCFGDDGVGYYR